MRWLLLTALVLRGGASFGAERVFDFAGVKLGEAPAGFRSTVAGSGLPGEWKTVLDSVPWLLPMPTASGKPERQPVLAQLSRDRTDERFPMLIFDGEVFGDFKFATKFKLVAGDVEQMAGIAFRIQDERNYYYVRASGLGNTFYFFVVKDGRRSAPIGPKMEIAKGVWHDLSVECRGQEIVVLLNDKPAIPAMQDATFRNGKIGFWTKSDAVTHFTGARISYKPMENLAQMLVREALAQYPRVLGLQIVRAGTNGAGPTILASADPAEAGQPGEKSAAEAIARDTIYYGKTRNAVVVTFPLHDFNGEVVGALRVLMKPFPGQTEKNAIVRAQPIARSMESRIRAGSDLGQ